MECTPRKCFRCKSEDHMIAKCPKPPKDNEKRRKELPYNEKGNRACDNGENNSDQKIYLYFSQSFLYRILRSREEKCSNFATQCTKETCISRKNHGDVKEKEITSKEENCFRVITSNIRSQIHQISFSWGYC